MIPGPIKSRSQNIDAFIQLRPGLIIISIAGLWFGQDAVRGSLTGQFRELLGPDGAKPSKPC